MESQPCEKRFYQERDKTTAHSDPETSTTPSSWQAAASEQLAPGRQIKHHVQKISLPENRPASSRRFLEHISLTLRSMEFLFQPLIFLFQLDRKQKRL